MKVVCAWCDVVLKAGHGPVSHGLCRPCFRRLEAAMDSNQPQALTRRVATVHHAAHRPA